MATASSRLQRPCRAAAMPTHSSLIICPSSSVCTHTHTHTHTQNKCGRSSSSRFVCWHVYRAVQHRHHSGVHLFNSLAAFSSKFLGEALMSVSPFLHYWFFVYHPNNRKGPLLGVKKSRDVHDPSAAALSAARRQGDERQTLSQGARASVPVGGRCCPASGAAAA